MASAEDKQPAARLAAVAAAGCLTTATNGSLNSYTTLGDTTLTRRLGCGELPGTRSAEWTAPRPDLLS